MHGFGSVLGLLEWRGLARRVTAVAEVTARHVLYLFHVPVDGAHDIRVGVLLRVGIGLPERVRLVFIQDVIVGAAPARGAQVRLPLLLGLLRSAVQDLGRRPPEA